MLRTKYVCGTITFEGCGQSHLMLWTGWDNQSVTVKQAQLCKLFNLAGTAWDSHIKMISSLVSNDQLAIQPFSSYIFFFSHFIVSDAVEISGKKCHLSHFFFIIGVGDCCCSTASADRRLDSCCCSADDVSWMSEMLLQCFFLLLCSVQSVPVCCNHRTRSRQLLFMLNNFCSDSYLYESVAM